MILPFPVFRQNQQQNVDNGMPLAHREKASNFGFLTVLVSPLGVSYNVQQVRMQKKTLSAQYGERRTIRTSRNKHANDEILEHDRGSSRNCFFSFQILNMRSRYAQLRWKVGVFESQCIPKQCPAKEEDYSSASWHCAKGEEKRHATRVHQGDGKT